jgi:hypothetical protein
MPYSRRLSDKILTVFHSACDEGDLETAKLLLAVLETVLIRRWWRPDDRRRSEVETLVAAHIRLWDLLHAAAPFTSGMPGPDPAR